MLSTSECHYLSVRHAHTHAISYHSPFIDLEYMVRIQPSRARPSLGFRVHVPNRVPLPFPGLHVQV